MEIELTNQDHAAVSTASKILCSRYRRVVEYEDVQQELYLWLIKNHHKADRWREQYETRHAERTVVKALRNAGERYCREEKAQKEGFEVEDEFFYSIPMVADLLSLSFDPDWMSPKAVELEAGGPTSSGKPASEGGNLMAMVADVGRAYSRMPKPDRDLLARCYGQGVSTPEALVELSLQWGITASAANSRVRRVVGRLRAALGGASPYQKDPQERIASER